MHWMLQLSLYHLLFILCGNIQGFISFSSFLNIYFLAIFLSLTDYNSFFFLAYWPSADTFSCLVSTCDTFLFLFPSHWKLPNAAKSFFCYTYLFFPPALGLFLSPFFVSTWSPSFFFFLVLFSHEITFAEFLELTSLEFPFPSVF